MKKMEDYLNGRKLIGNDFDSKQIKAWFDDEREGYAQIGDKSRSKYRYVYHALNAIHGYSKLPSCEFKQVLGMGSAYGDEFLPIINRIHQISILEPSEKFRSTEIEGVPCTYLKPSPSGSIPFENNAFDLITCFGVLHHIPNVSYVLTEMHRCLKPGGYALVREPIVSMGDWTKPRAGLTKRERGIPLALMRQFVSAAGFTVLHETLTGFPLVYKPAKKLGWQVYNSTTLTKLDFMFSKIFAWNLRYHRSSVIQKISPTAVYMVLKK
ncbi:methyltransferase domain-containing protein [bacterium]|nr:methyltransferase domain-containing protein [bacterium]